MQQTGARRLRQTILEGWSDEPKESRTGAVTSMRVRGRCRVPAEDKSAGFPEW